MPVFDQNTLNIYCFPSSQGLQERKAHNIASDLVGRSPQGMLQRMGRSVLVFLLLALTVTATAYRDDELEEGADESAYVHFDNNDIQKAKTDYDRMVTYSQMPRYGDCWSTALTTLKESCRSMTEHAQHRLAFQFTNCFLLTTGIKIVSCNEADTIAECITRAKVEPEFFHTYRDFFTHTQSVCFYIASEEWNRQAEAQVNRLMSASHSVSLQLEESQSVQAAILDKQKVAALQLEESKTVQVAMLESQRMSTLQLEESKSVQESILDKQQKALASSEALVAHNDRLNQSITESQMALIGSFRELQRSTSETRLWMSDISASVSRLQSLFIDEFTTFYSLVFYVTAGVACFVLTSTKRTAAARIWLFLLLVGTFYLERQVGQYRLAEFEGDGGQRLTDSSIITHSLNEDAWFIRRIALAIATAVVVYFFYKYQDIHENNHILMLKLQEQFMELKSVVIHSSGRAPIDGPRRDGSSSDTSMTVPDKVVDFVMDNVDRLRRSLTPLRTFLQDEPDSTPHGHHSSSNNLKSVPEEDEDDRRSISMDGGDSTPRAPPRKRMSREVSPLSLDRMTPNRVLRSGSHPRESPVRSPSVQSSSSAFGRRLHGRRDINRREPTPEETRDGLKQLIELTSRAKQHFQEDFSMRNGNGSNDE
ncbi:hypothetical protein BV898_03760 [Hypsibius exemplaris]|uniref:Protein GAMETE EXPRESSED 1 n=1 Tax=Hypsibius exemplaris TaxID=2072580 RepID=A0A1W0X3X8_HYPEX|nr:hypothetical protein BV898_03760 [Hypsibius exemplaris]